MFPKKLDGARVLYYTGEGDFGVVTNTNETDAERICYLAICKYEKDNGYYQFIHDFEINDGVERYYVVNDNIDRSSLFTPKQKKNIIKFRKC